MNQSIITICSSAYFYKEVLKIEKQLRELGFAVIVPATARKMGESGNFKVADVRTWLTNPDDYVIKAKLMQDHFNEVVKSDAILVVNLEKRGVAGYIGGNVLMEMAVAMHLKKPIFIYNQIGNDLAWEEEVRGVLPIFINQDLTLIANRLWEHT